jgi:adenosylhomocysteine nucleosidase
MGKIKAGVNTLENIKLYEPDLIINFGTAGSMRDDLQGVVECGVFLDKENVGKPIVFDKTKAKIASSDYFVLEKGHDCDLIDMEAYSIASLCKKMNIDFKCYKYVTDYIGSNSFGEWEQKAGDGGEHYLRILDDYLKNSI